MPDLTLDAAQSIVAAALAEGGRRGLKPLAVVVYDARGTLKALAAQDGTSLRRVEIAMGKAHGALAMGLGSRALATMVAERPHFVAAATHAVGAPALIPVPGGVLVRSGGAVIGAVGISGDLSDNDEACALAGIAAAGLEADPGA